MLLCRRSAFHGGAMPNSPPTGQAPPRVYQCCRRAVRARDRRDNAQPDCPGAPGTARWVQDRQDRRRAAAACGPGPARAARRASAVLAHRQGWSRELGRNLCIAWKGTREEQAPSLETKTPTCRSGRRMNGILGGPGRNRTTDTRIFNPLRWQRATRPRLTPIPGGWAASSPAG